MTPTFLTPAREQEIRERYSHYADVPADQLTDVPLLLRALDAERATVQRLTDERNKYRTLANIGAWHEDCRPNREMAARVIGNQQQANNKLADTISELRAQLAESQQTIARLTAGHGQPE